jgi:hypothetical protein
MENQKQNRDLLTRLKQGVVVAGAVAITGAANAAVDTTDITAELTGAATAGAAVAAVAILIPLGIKVFKYIRSAF